MNYAEIKKFDIANGKGVRVSVFVSGCRHRCKNCFNSVAWDFTYGKEFTQGVIDEVLNACLPSYISGLSILGGEPFEPENQSGILELTKQFKEKFPQKDIWCYSGFTFEELIGGKAGDPKKVKEILSKTDILVDGKFIEELKDLSLMFRGSSNQTVVDVKKSLLKGIKTEAEGVWKRKPGSTDIYNS